MNPDRRAGIGPQNRNPDINPFARVVLAGLIAAGSSTYLPPFLEKLASGLQITPVASAFTPDCRVGLGVTVDNGAFSKGARVIVAEDLSLRRIADRRLRVGEEVLVVFEGPSNAVKGGKDARRFVYFTTDADGRQRVSSRVETIVTCGKFEHIRSVVEEEAQKGETPTPSRTATPTSSATPASASTPLPAVTLTPDRVATLEAKLQGIIAQSTRTAEDDKLARNARVEGASEARATIEAEKRATETVTRLIEEAKVQGRREALVTATAAVSSTAGASGRPWAGINLPANLPVDGMAAGASLAALIAALGLVFDRPNRLRTRFGNTIAFPFREIGYRRGPLRAHNQGLNNGTIAAGTPAPVRGHPGIWGV